MDMFLYLNKKSLIHNLDPRVKIIILLVSFAIAVMFNSMTIMLFLFGLIIFYGILGESLINLGRIRVVLFMIATFSILIWSISKGGDTKILKIFSLEGVWYGVMIALKTNAMIVSGMIFLSCTKIEEISQGLVKLKVPYRGAFAFSTAIRLVPMIVGTSYTIIQAQKSRGLDLDSGSLLKKVKKMIPLMIPTIISVIRGTNVFAMALESKGFGYSKKRGSYLAIKMKGFDYFMLLMIFTLLGIAIYIKTNNLGDFNLLPIIQSLSIN